MLTLLLPIDTRAKYLTLISQEAQKQALSIVLSILPLFVFHHNISLLSLTPKQEGLSQRSTFTMPKEDFLHEPLINESNNSDDDRFLPDRESGGSHHGHGIKSYNFFYKVTIMSLVFILAITATLLIRIEMQFHHKLDQTCASHTTSWCK